jgi:hypothetical protein
MEITLRLSGKNFTEGFRMTGLACTTRSLCLGVSAERGANTRCVRSKLPY